MADKEPGSATDRALIGRERGSIAWSIVAVAVAFFAIGDLGIVSRLDAAVFLTATVLARPRWAVPALLLLVTTQNAPGMSPTACYATFGTVCLMAWLADTRAAPLMTTSGAEASGWMRFNGLAVAAVMTCLVTVGVSTVRAALGEPQDPLRPFALVGALTIVAIASGVVVVRGVRRSGGIRREAMTAIVASVVHMLIVSGVQAVQGPQTLTGEAGTDVLTAAGTELAGGLNAVRIGAQMLSPNALGLILLLLAVVYLLLSAPERPSRKFVMAFAFLGLAGVALSQSKAVAGLFVAFGIVLAAVRGWAWLVSLMAGATGALVVVLQSGLAALLVVGFRIQFEGTVRPALWEAVVRTFRIQDWLFGLGYSEWRPFFAKYAGVAALDPHSIVLSVPGTFGLLGVALMLAVTLVLIVAVVRGPLLSRLGAVFLLLLVYGHDLASTPSLLYNNPIALLPWAILGFVLTPVPVRGAVRTVPPHSPT